MADALKGIDDDVPFDFGAADALIGSCRAASSAIEGQLGSRSSYVATAGADFRGQFSRLFADNAATARADAHELSARLREVVTGAERLKDEARKEQQRRETAREWKREHDDRNALEKGWDSVFGEDSPPVGPAASPVSIPVSAPRNAPRQTPSPGGGGAGGGTSSARPSDLRSFASGSANLNSALRPQLARSRGDFHTFQARCHWGTLSADGVFVGFDRWLALNDDDVTWANTVAAAFTAAGGDGAVSSLPDSALLASLQAAGVNASRQDLSIDPPTAYGHPPTTGYADDPVNTSTGNFLESEGDLGFSGGCESLLFTRTYNSLNQGVSSLGVGWSSWPEVRLELDDEAARFVMPDGRQVPFPRLGAGWDRAVGENYWLERLADELVVSGNDGARWTFDATGLLTSLSSGPGTTVRLEHAEGRLARMVHERGRSITLDWDEPVPGSTRLVGLRGDDRREVRYLYDDRARLIACTTDVGMRCYDWNDDDLLCLVGAADGTVEVVNTYDEQRRVAQQVSAHGRTTRYAYLPGRVTVVSDDDGGRANTWIADDRGRLVGVLDADGQRLSTAYDVHGNPVLTTERDGAVTVRQYDRRGRLVRWVTPEGADFTQDWDEADRLVRLTVTTGEGAEPAVTVLSYAGDERHPETLVDPEGGRTRMTWVRGLLAEVVDPVGVALRFEHDEHGDLVSTTDALGQVARLERDEAGRVTAVVAPSGHRTQFTFDASTGLLAQRADADGAVWRFEHRNGRPSAIVDPLGGRVESEVDDDGRTERTIDQLGRATTRHLDDLGNVAEVVLPDGARWGFDHDALSRLRRVIDPSGAVRAEDYDAQGQLAVLSGAAGERIAVQVDRAARTANVTDGDDTAALEVDRLGRIVASQGPDGSTVLTRYDRCGRPVEVVDAAGGLTVIARDAAGRVVSITHPGGGVQRYEYDACGRPCVLVDELGGRTLLEHDADGRLVAEVAPTGERATWTYDALGRIVKHRAPGIGTTLTAYDLTGRVSESWDPQHGRRRFGYDAAGQLVEATDGNGGTTRWDYDANGRVVAITDPLGAVTRREHDELGRVVAETDRLGRTSRAGYDGSGRQAWQADAAGVRTEWSYDQQGRLSTVAVDGVVVCALSRGPGGLVVRVDDDTVEGRTTVHELTYDTRGLLVARSRDGRAIGWTYDADGRRVSRTGPDGDVTRYERDAAGRVTAVDHPTLGRALFERDASGRVVAARTDAIRAAWTYREGFVARCSVDDGDSRSRSQVVRDDLGRITSLRHDDVTSTFEHDAACQLVALRVGDSVVQWRYDRAGRLVAESRDGVVRELDHDPAGQLTSTREPDGRVVRHTYDAAGRRTRSVEAAGTTRELVWTRTGHLGEVVDLRADGSRSSTTLAVDALGELARVDDAEVFLDTAAPVVGTPAQVGDAGVVSAWPLVGADGRWHVTGWRQVRASDPHDPWSSGGPSGVGVDGALRLAGLEWMGARVYDPTTRSFLATDPLDATTGAGWAGNPYAFAGNDPLHALDPTGLSPVTDAELKAYAAAHQGALHAAGDWMKDNWEYVAAGAMVVGGVVLMATGVGGPAGMALIAAGVDAGLQKYTTGGVNWGQVAVTGVIGLAGGGAAMWATRASQGGVAALRTTVMVNAGINSASSGAVYVVKNHDNLTVRGAAAALTAGAVSGAIGGVAGPAGGTIATSFGRGSTSLTATAATGGINFVAGATGNIAGTRVAGGDIDLTSAAISGAVNTGGGYLGNRVAPGNGQNTLNQMSYFGPRTVSGAFNVGAVNTNAMWASGATGAAVGSTYDLSGP